METAATSTEPVVKRYPALVEVNGKILFEPINDAQLDYIQAAEPNLFFWGNRGGGKSVTARWTCHARALSYPGYRYAILRTSFPELIKNHLIYLGTEMENLGGGYNGSKFIAKYPNGSMGFYMQAETEQQARNALGVEMMEVVFDEAPTFKWEHMVMIASSVRVPVDSGLTPLKRYLGNPMGPCIDDLWKYFINKDVDLEEDPEYRPHEWRSIEIDHKDNTKLDIDAYRRQLGAGLPIHIRKAWLDGEKYDFGQLFEVVKTKDGRPYHVINELPTIDGKPVIYFDEVRQEWVHPEWVRVFRAYDHGYWPDPAVCLWFAVFGKQIVCFKEMTRYRRVAKELAEEIRAESRGMKVVTTYCDPTLQIQSGHDVVTILDTFELNGIPMDPSVNNREHYAHAINSALKAEYEPGKPRFQMYAPGCPYLTKSLPQMRYDEKNPLAMADHKHDHAPVAAAYFLMSVMHAMEREAASVVKRPKWMKRTGQRIKLGAGNVRRAA